MSSGFEVHEKEINGRQYSTTLLPAGESLKLFVETKGLVAGSLGAILTGKVEDTFAKLAGNLTPEEFLTYVLRILRTTTVEGDARPFTRDNFNLHFAGKLAELARVVGWVMEMNWADFIGEVRRLVGQAREKNPEAVARAEKMLMEGLMGLSSQPTSMNDGSSSASPTPATTSPG